MARQLFRAHHGFAVVILASPAFLVVPHGAADSSQECSSGVQWHGTGARCINSTGAPGTPRTRHNHPDTIPQYPLFESTSTPACFSGPQPPADDGCSAGSGCTVNDAGEQTYLHWKSTRTVWGPGEATEWVTLGYECRAVPQGTSGPTVVDIERAFRRLSWPKAELHIQPTGGTTLVNKNTHAHTTNPGPVTKDITLLGQNITIEATPTSWTWHWDDGTTHTTDHPGAPHPDAITHTYTKASPRLRPRVDVTYQGRYRLNGGDWQPLTNTHTVAGDPQTLEVREAISQLVR